MDIHQDMTAAQHLDMWRDVEAHCRGHLGKFMMILNTCTCSPPPSVDCIDLYVGKIEGIYGRLVSVWIGMG